MKTEQLTKPRKLFTVTITVYVVLLACIIAACYFVKYPTTYDAKTLKTEEGAHQLNLKLALPLGSQLGVGDRITIGNAGGKQQEALITNISKENKKMIVILLGKSPLKFFADQTEPIKCTKHQRLFTILIKKIN